MKIGDPVGRCPICSGPCTLHDFCEVDIGVGIQTFNHEYECAKCGAFVHLEDRTHFQDPESDASYLASDACKEQMAHFANLKSIGL